MDLIKELDTYYNMVYAEHITETKLVNLLITIKEKCERILRFASHYDYDKNHKFNGYRSTVLFVVKFLEAVHCTKLNHEFDGTVDEVILILQALNKTLSSVLQFHENSLNYHRRSEIIESNNDHSMDNQKSDTKKVIEDQVHKLKIPIDRQSLIEAFDAMEDNQVPFVFNKYYEFFYKDTNLNTINQTMLSYFLENFDPWSWFKTLTSSTFTDTSIFLNITQLGLNESTFGGALQLNMLKNWLPFLSNSKPYIVETIQIKRELEWLICPISFELKHNPMKFQVLNNRKKFIKCKLLRNTVNSSGHLLIYIFSSDYFNKTNDVSNSFLCDWSLKLPGCSILVPELIYDDNEKFITPLQLQDCLDCYLWAIGKNNRCINKIELLNRPKESNANNLNKSFQRRNSSIHSRSASISGSSSSFFNNILSSNHTTANNPNTNGLNSNSSYSNPFTNSEQVLDGIPQQIILSGDSSGGNIATALLLVLNDLKTKFNYKDLQLPQGLALAFTPFNLRDYSPIMLTSRFNYSLSPIIALTAVESNLPLPEIEDYDLIVLNETKKKITSELNDSLVKSEKIIINDRKRRRKAIEQTEKETNSLKQQERKKCSNSMNSYLIDKLNDIKLSDFFQQFSYLNSCDRDDLINEQDSDVETDSSDSSDSSYDINSSVTYSSPTNDEINLGYFTKTLINFLSQYYNYSFTPDDCEEKLIKRTTGGVNRDTDRTKLNSSDTIKRKVSKNLRSDLEQMKNFNNPENESSMIQNAFTMFRLFFNGTEKKSNEKFEWNKEIVDKIFTEQRENAFLNLTSRPYISPAFYDDFESLEQVSIYLLNSTCDMWLDQSICMSKRWKGNVTLKVLDDQLPRGFLIERFLQDAKEGQTIFFEMVKHALELKKSLPKFLPQN